MKRIFLRKQVRSSTYSQHLRRSDFATSDTPAYVAVSWYALAGKLEKQKQPNQANWGKRIFEAQV